MLSTYKLKRYLKSHLSKKRYKHTVRVAKIAKELALIYNIDVYKAEYASLGHDIAKEMNIQEARTYIDQYQIEMDPTIRQNPNLAHGEIGAIILEKKFECEDHDILEAVRWHTYGHKDMSLLSKIVYMADVIEESRCFEGVEELRRLARIDIDAAILKFYELTLDYFKENNQEMHQNTYQMIESIKEMHL
ncbi:bis(5'-nucleosyl)-tetraphosphatase (symmetrical) YqeK [Fusibacter ferrireducens]|uniref:bis(5'-nucleosyl)-tetraphosphatase (symmetrical) n=1 Tax=Fusibacter ferrireducens TaxID=2785058 RepID=A0ABR9ZWN6_9FIRM|nr:bis(5'-nucleosyl)-tetraphosphatase (symmetrical) YqeK [Fusibacter ferrireducens]MBF4694882.1 bis(5'-nucleosyl)-tetraphosphatase (symmetrical) YqeK [Fusibacter ferrireducens]